ncbi:DUF3243 domain-containing protein [Neobacillus mesonae]|uniref:DUF3243 domain-containing protein n=1 Tax=Neobacillus mesonae TaxID=1193713 RepID=A0A3Q9QVZ9_9BACI|nr:DUF3243 domain-containing protein [Neobacillus mesonae]AZU61552.1 DUF3243 domain-containing protein [Neobacillus mesonae]
MSVLDNWKEWQDFLGDRLQNAQTQGMSEGAIGSLAHQIGDYLSQNVDPKNEQQRVLSDMWSVANDQEQQAIANVMVKLVKQ